MSKITYTCPYCGAILSTKKNLSRHINKCVLNPNLPERYLRYINGQMDSSKKQIYLYDEKEYTRKCDKCGKEYTFKATRKDYDTNQYPHCCSK